MSTSVIDRRTLNTAFFYLLLSLLCAIGGAVYEVFSHGVWSGYMVYAFLFPLSLGALPYLCLTLWGQPLPPRWTRNFHHAGVATLTVGSFFEGALAIYGTTNRLTAVYWIAGTALLLPGLAGYIAHLRKLS